MELTLFVDHQCNLRCTYCYNGEKFTRRMSIEQVRDAIRLTLRTTRDALEVSFFGGEPLLHTAFIAEAVALVEDEVRRAAPGMMLTFVMNTNGTLIDDDAIRLMSTAENPGRRFMVNLSVDGPPEVHDKVRLTAGGKGSFAAVSRGIARLREAGIPYQVLAVVTPESARRLGPTVETLLALDPQKAQLSIDYRAAWDEASIGDLRAGLVEAGDAWMRAFRAGKTIPLNPMHGKILAHLHGGMPCASRCVLGNGEMTVTPKGNIYPCAQMVGEDVGTDLVIGHLSTGVDPDHVRRLMAAKERIDETCGDCQLRDRCQSHCGCRHVALTGELGKITAALCETEAAFVDEADRIAEILFAEKCPAFLSYYYERSWAPTAGSRLVTLRRPAPAIS